jgi:hypothetical protein
VIVERQEQLLAREWELDGLCLRAQCDTPSAIVAATMFKQSLTMYSRSLNEILACLVCIINVVRFEFQIQTLFFCSNHVV